MILGRIAGFGVGGIKELLRTSHEFARTPNRCELTFAQANDQITGGANRSKIKKCIQWASAEPDHPGGPSRQLVLRNKRLTPQHASFVQPVLENPTVRKALVSLQLQEALRGRPRLARWSVVYALRNMRWLESLDVSKNELLHGGESSMPTESSSHRGSHDRGVSLDISDNRCLTRAVAPGDLRVFAALVAEILKCPRITELNLSRNFMQRDACRVVAKGLQKHKTIVTANLLSNGWGTEQVRKLATILEGHPSLKSLCGNKGVEQELDMSGRYMGAEGAMMLAPEIVANDALTRLDLSDNHLVDMELPDGWVQDAYDFYAVAGPYDHDDYVPAEEFPPEGATINVAGAIALAGALQHHPGITRLDIRSNHMATQEVGIAMANVLTANATLQHLDLSMNTWNFEEGTLPPQDDGAGFANELAVGVGANGALIHLDIRGNKIGYLTALPPGWHVADRGDRQVFKPPDGPWTWNAPPEAKAVGAMALANAIKRNRGLKTLRLGNNCLTGGEAGDALGEALAANTVLNDLDLASPSVSHILGGRSPCDAVFVKAFSVGLGANRALTRLDISYNDIGLLSVPDGWETSTDNFRGQCFKPPGGQWSASAPACAEPRGAIALANAIKTHVQLVTLTMRGNTLKGVATGRAMGDAIATNTVLRELDLSSPGERIIDGIRQCFHPGDAAFVEAFAVGLRANKTLTRLDLSNNPLYASGCKALADSLRGNHVMAELKLSVCDLSRDATRSATNISGVLAMCDAIPTMRALARLDMDANGLGKYTLPLGWSEKYGNAAGYGYVHTDGRTQRDAPNGSNAVGGSALANAIRANPTLSSVNILKNEIPAEQAEMLVKVMRSNASLTTLCGLSGHETALDYNRHDLGDGDAVLVANDIRNHKAVTHLNLGNNAILSRASGKALAEALAHNTVLKSLVVSGNQDKYPHGAPRGTLDGTGFVEELAMGVKKNTSLLTLDLSTNALLTAEVGNIFTDMLRANTALTQLDVSNNRWGEALAELQGDAPGFARTFLAGLGDNRTLTRLNISQNDIGDSVPDGWKAERSLASDHTGRWLHRHA